MFFPGTLGTTFAPSSLRSWWVPSLGSVTNCSWCSHSTISKRKILCNRIMDEYIIIIMITLITIIIIYNITFYIIYYYYIYNVNIYNVNIYYFLYNIVYL